MFLSKRSNGIYYLYYEKPDGKRTAVSTGAKKKAEANIFLNEFKKTQSDSSNIKFSQFRIDYLKYSEQIHSPSTTQAIKVIFNEFNSYFESSYLNKISKLDTANYIMKKAKVSSHIAQKHLAHLRKAFNYAIELGILESNPFRDIKNFRTPERQPIFFSKEDFNKLLSVIEDRDFRDIVLFSLYTGMRRAEAVNLKWNQIDINEKLIILDNREHLTKSKRIRSIPMNDEVYRILKERERNNSYVFTKNYEQFKLDFITKKFKKYVKKAKLKEDYKWHCLRHTFASWLVQKDVPIQKVSKLLGHQDLSTTQIYSHLRNEDLRNSINLLTTN